MNWGACLLGTIKSSSGDPTHPRLIVGVNFVSGLGVYMAVDSQRSDLRQH